MSNPTATPTSPVQPHRLPRHRLGRDRSRTEHQSGAGGPLCVGRHGQGPRHAVALDQDPSGHAVHGLHGRICLTMIFAGRMQDKIGPRFIAMFGGLMLGLGLIASAFTESPLIMLITFGGNRRHRHRLGLFGHNAAVHQMVSPRKKGVITGLVVSGVGLAAVYISPLTQYLLGPDNMISHTFLVLGIGTISWSDCCPSY